MGFDLETIRGLIYLYSFKVFMALIIFVVGRWISTRLTALFGRLMVRHDVDETLVGFLRGVAYYTLLAVVITATAAQLGINTTSFIGIIGAAGLAVGLALKDSLSNFAAGVMLILFRPFKVGDFVTVGGASGTVSSISLFNTIFTSPDNQRIIVPNGKIMADTITNVTANPVRRVDITVGIGYEDDIDKAVALLKHIVGSEEKVLKDPPSQIAVAELGDSSVNIVVRPWVNTADYWQVRCALVEKIKKEFDRAGITIPYPQQDVHLFVESDSALRS